MTTKPQYGKRHQRLRRVLLEADPWCHYCGAPATIADHSPPVALHDHRGPDAGCCTLVPSCKPCSDRQGRRVRDVRDELRSALRLEADAASRLNPDATGMPAESDVWAVPWLDTVREVPDGARWPRFMSAPHPDAVGSLGDYVTASALAAGVMLRWWQRLAVWRMLEVDADGDLVWDEVILSTPRRAGKSVLLRELAWWRLTGGAAVFGEEQMILHTSRTLATTLDVAREAMSRAADHPRMRVDRRTGREGITYGDNRWLMRAETSAYGLGAGLAIADEVWDYTPETVTEGIQPTMMERRCPQLLLVSTAHRRATKLLPERRAAALADLETPRRRLLLEWSAPAGGELLEAAEAASPVWDKARRRHVEAAVDDARRAVPVPGSVDPLEMFVSQYVNDWSAGRLLGRAKGDPLVEVDAWEAALGATRGEVAVAAVEDYYGRGFALAYVTADPDSLEVCVGGRFVGDRDSLRLELEELAPREVLAGASIAGDATFDGFPTEPVGSRETRGALHGLRRLLDEHRLRHDGSPDLARQIAELRVTTNVGGLAVLPGHRSDLVRAAAWAVARVESGRAASVGVF